MTKNSDVSIKLLELISKPKVLVIITIITIIYNLFFPLNISLDTSRYLLSSIMQTMAGVIGVCLAALVYRVTILREAGESIKQVYREEFMPIIPIEKANEAIETTNKMMQRSINLSSAPIVYSIIVIAFTMFYLTFLDKVYSYQQINGYLLSFLVCLSIWSLTGVLAFVYHCFNIESNTDQNK